MPSVPTSYLVVRLLPYLLLLSVVQLVLESTNATDALKAAVDVVGGAGLLVFAGYQGNVLAARATRGQAMWSAWWICLIGIPLNVLESLWGLRSVPNTPISAPLTLTSSDQINAVLVGIFIFLAVAAVLTLITCWLLSGFGYWIAGGAGQGKQQ